MERGAIDEGESEVELDTEGADTGLSRGMRGRRRGGSRTTTSRSAAQHGGVTATSRPKPSRKSTRDMESEMEIDGEDTNRGRDAGKGEESQGMSTGIQGRVPRHVNDGHHELTHSCIPGRSNSLSIQEARCRYLRLYPCGCRRRRRCRTYYRCCRRRCTGGRRSWGTVFQQEPNAVQEEGQRKGATVSKTHGLRVAA